MDLDIGEDKQERRKKHYITPIIFTILEIILAWLVISIIEVNFEIQKWDIFGIYALVLSSIYSIYKMIKIYKRQKNYKR